MKKEKDSFVFYRDWQRALQNLPDNERLQVYDAIVLYGLDNTESSDLSATASIAMSFIIPQIDRCNAKYEERCKVLRENGLKGGRPRKNQKVISKPKGFSENQKVFSKTKQNHNDNVNDNKNEDESISTEVVTSVSANADVQNETIDISKFIEFWNQEVSGTIIPPIRSIEGARLAKLKARLKQYGKSALFEAVKKATHSEFLKGNISDSSWHATFDWFICPSNFIKVLEGNFDNTQNHAQFRRNSHEIQREQRYRDTATLVEDLFDEDR